LIGVTSKTAARQDLARAVQGSRAKLSMATRCRLAAAETDVGALSKAVELALSYDAKLDVAAS
jgi:hypothetical protein